MTQATAKHGDDALRKYGTVLVTKMRQDSLTTAENGPDLVAAIAEVASSRTSLPLAIYVGVPFCPFKCHFCDWVADVPANVLRSDSAGRDPYVDAVCKQIRYYGPQLTAIGYRPRYMYWGGGTPTRLDIAQLRRIYQAISESFDLTDLKQWSVETTPTDLDEAKLEALMSFGINRVSLGVQSLNPEQLRKTGRRHTPREADSTVRMVLSSGIASLNTDIMTGFPEEDLDWIDRTVDGLLDLGVPHFSVYPFRTSKNTIVESLMRKGALTPGTLEHQLESFARAKSRLNAAGYEYGGHHGAFRQDERHEDKDGNYKYQLMGDKIGFGTGAESVIGHRLLWNPHKRMQDFIADPISFASTKKFTLDAPQMFINCIAGSQMAYVDGLNFERFETLTGVSFHELRKLPWTRQMLGYLRKCGGEFIETSEVLRLDQSCVDHVTIAHQSFVTENMRDAAVAAGAPAKSAAGL